MSQPHEPKTALLAEAVCKSYEDGAIEVLRSVDLLVSKGETVALCGPSGCGKSTLLHLLGGLDRPNSGAIFVEGVAIHDHPDPLRMLRTQVGFVFQLHNLIPDLTLEENCLIPAVAAGTPKQVARERMLELTERTGIRHRLTQRMQKLSGGERQRTAICRALMNRPRILLADEPTGSLDGRSSAVVFDLLMELVDKEGVTLVMATHDRALARACDRLVEMQDGRIHDAALTENARFEGAR